MKDIAEYQREQELIMAEKLQDHIPDEQLKAFRKKYCRRCTYRSIQKSNGKNPQTNLGTCNYILRTGHQRPCAVGRCVERGVFKKRADE